MFQLAQWPVPGEQPLAEAEGNGGYIWVFLHKVRIKRSGLRGAFTVGVLKGDKELQIDQISGMQWRDAGQMWLGHIQFTLIGGSTDSRLATKDENAPSVRQWQTARVRGRPSDRGPANE